jgi:S-methylmethionine-dependent homocysteine/selenocysteine methylase
MQDYLMPLEYDETPEQMQVFIKEYLDDNLINIIGGCCGTTPEHIIDCGYCKVTNPEVLVWCYRILL